MRSGALVEREYDDGEQAWLDLDGEDALTQLQGAFIRYRIAVGPIAGRKLQRLYRYEARPAIAHARLSRHGDGLVVYELKHPFRDGTTHVCCTRIYECRGRQTGVVLAILLHSRHPWRTDAGRDITDPRVLATLLAHLENRSVRAPPPTRHGSHPLHAPFAGTLPAHQGLAWSRARLASPRAISVSAGPLRRVSRRPSPVCRRVPCVAHDDFATARYRTGSAE